ncbi:MAG: hypothetical protein AAF738_11165, partial [Bacteroidota bacterium]
MKKAIHFVFIIALAASFLSSSGGRNGNFAGAPGDSGTGTCSNCHSGGHNNNGGGMTLTGLPTSLMPSTTY